MAYLIDRIQASLQKEGLETRTRDSRDWLRTKITNLRPTKASLMNDMTRLRERSMVGKMYFFLYDPKTKDKMKYYDRFPLVLPVESYPDGFLGLNLHYIHPKQRLILLDKLSSYTNNNKFDKTTKLRLTYQILKSASKVFEKNACIKRYLFTQIQSRFLEINADEWDIAALLPVESFTSEKRTVSKTQVFQDSKDTF
jgi:hypothetical protein